jgi:hypothetical protein
MSLRNGSIMPQLIPQSCEQRSKPTPARQAGGKASNLCAEQASTAKDSKKEPVLNVAEV